MQFTSKDHSARMPLLSIIIPTYNSASCVERCLESILLQDFQEFEILIQDGLSTDNTIDIVKRKQFQNLSALIYLWEEKDSGIYDAMNMAIKKAKGEWLLFLGSDDIIFDESVLKKVSAELKKTKYKIVYGSAKINGSAGWAMDSDIYDGPFNLGKLLQKNICHQAIFYRREIFTEIGYYNIDYPICADYEFNLRCYARYKFKFIETIISSFNGGGTSILNIDENFAKDKEQIIISNFSKVLYRKEFRPFKSIIRKLIFSRNYNKGIGSRVLLFINFLTLQFHSIKAKVFSDPNSA